MTIGSSQTRAELHAHPIPDQKHLLRRFWQSAAGFWSGWGVWGMIGLLIAIVLLQLLVQYCLNYWNRDFFNALERKDGSELWAQARLFVPLAAASLVLALLSVWGRMTAQRSWREWLTKHLIDYWLGDDRYRRLRSVPGEPEYPEYRIADDARVATDAPIDLALGLLTSLLNAITFVSILWSVGGNLVVHAFGVSLTLPGYLVIAVIGYSAFLAVAMLYVGRDLTPVIEEKNEAEAALRSTACHLREAGEGTVMRSNTLQQRRDLRSMLERVIARWRDLCMQLVRTTVVGHVNFLFAPVLAWTLCAPKYLNGAMALGEATQVAAAFVIVQGALNWFVDNYQRLADWVSSVNRVSSLLLALDQIDARETTVASPAIMRVSPQRAPRQTAASSRKTRTACRNHAAPTESARRWFAEWHPSATIAEWHAQPEPERADGRSFCWDLAAPAPGIEKAE